MCRQQVVASVQHLRFLINPVTTETGKRIAYIGAMPKQGPGGANLPFMGLGVPSKLFQIQSDVIQAEAFLTSLGGVGGRSSVVQFYNTVKTRERHRCLCMYAAV